MNILWLEVKCSCDDKDSKNVSEGWQGTAVWGWGAHPQTPAPARAALQTAFCAFASN